MLLHALAWVRGLVAKICRNVHCVVFTGDTDATKISILKRAQDRFNVAIDESA
jgi:hypothetical protein